MPANQFFDLPIVTLDDRKRALVEHMQFLQSMNVYELTLYKKWQRMQEYRSLLNRAAVVKGNIWTPNDWLNALPDFERLQPRIRVVDSKADQQSWDILREFVSSHIFEQNPGRHIKFLVDDAVTEKYLGCVAASSDMMELGGRDKWIGWSREQKIAQGKLNNLANAAVLVPVQPFGFNFLGGKLMATLITSPIVQQAWRDRYNDVLVGFTTTSLYGAQSQYNGMPFWKGMGETVGKVFLTPDPVFYREWVEWLKKEHYDDWRNATINDDTESGLASGSKLRLLAAIFKHLGLNPTDFYHGFHRGVYFCQLYENTREFLRGEITETGLVTKPIYGVEWWRTKAYNRYSTLCTKNGLNLDATFYNLMVDMTWEQAKATYLKVVGR